jgi:hypothetical protein
VDAEATYTGWEDFAPSVTRGSRMSSEEVAPSETPVVLPPYILSPICHQQQTNPSLDRGKRPAEEPAKCSRAAQRRRISIPSSAPCLLGADRSSIHLRIPRLMDLRDLSLDSLLLPLALPLPLLMSLLGGSLLLSTIESLYSRVTLSTSERAAISYRAALRRIARSLTLASFHSRTLHAEQRAAIAEWITVTAEPIATDAEERAQSVIVLAGVSALLTGVAILIGVLSHIIH